MLSFDSPKEKQELFFAQLVQNGAEYQKALEVAEILSFKQTEDFVEHGKQLADDFSDRFGLRD